MKTLETMNPKQRTYAVTGSFTDAKGKRVFEVIESGISLEKAKIVQIEVYNQNPYNYHIDITLN